MQISEPEPQDLDPAKTEEAEDYYMEDDCDDDDGYDEDEYEFDEAGFNQHLADKFDVMDLPPGVEATVPWLQKIAPKEEDPRPSDVDTTDENTKKYNQFKQFDTVQNFTDHHFAQNSQGEVKFTLVLCFIWTLSNLRVYTIFSQPEHGQREFNMTGNFWRRIYQVSHQQNSEFPFLWAFFFLCVRVCVCGF
jgi:hypothetical protein